MKTDRFARAAAVVLAVLILAAGQQAVGETISFKWKKSGMAAALAGNVGKVVKQLKKDRRALRGVTGPDGERAFPQEAVAGLIARTEKDVDQAIVKVREPGLDALRAWAAEEFRQIQEDLPPAPDATPQAVAVVASLEGFSLPKLASVNAAAPQQKTIPAETANRLLDRAGEVASRIFVLAKKNDLKVKLWVGSTPAPRAEFSFWSRGRIKGAAPMTDDIIRTNDRKDDIPRGLYSYRATFGEGPGKQVLQYPIPASAPGDQSKPLDLVNGTSFFCCQFNGSEQYCHHVKNKKECR